MKERIEREDIDPFKDGLGKPHYSLLETKHWLMTHHFFLIWVQSVLRSLRWPTYIQMRSGILVQKCSTMDFHLKIYLVKVHNLPVNCGNLSLKFIYRVLFNLLRAAWCLNALCPLVVMYINPIGSVWYMNAALASRLARAAFKHHDDQWA